MTNERRRLYLDVMDGYIGLINIMYQWEHLVRCDDILKWLLANNLRGKKLYETIKTDFAFSSLKTAQYILQKIDKNLEQKPVIYGVDYRD